ncbi:MAG: glycosyl hydrolase family 17 [Pseudomonadota bacterium]
MKLRIYGAAVALAALITACSSDTPEPSADTTMNTMADAAAEDSGFVKRPFQPMLDGEWIGNGISYGAYRDGESPGSGVTSKENILEDLTILAPRWRLIRLYGADAQALQVLEVIEENDLPIRVMQGIWLDGNKTAEENEEQVRLAIEYANRFPEIIVAVNVGNEILVDWSYHRIEDIDSVVEKIREVRAAVEQPVTVADDYNFWNKPQAKQVADELDFLCLHAYAFWNNKTLDIAMDWTVEIYDDIQGRHPEHTIAYCETGWPTSRVYDDGSYEGGLIGKAGEAEQEVFFNQYDPWADSNKVISFYFTSFDEQWKGGFDGDNPMDKAEKHWGLYFSDRTPKQVLQEPAEE